MEARELMLTRAVARRGSDEKKSEWPWSQGLEGDQITVIYFKRDSHTEAHQHT